MKNEWYAHRGCIFFRLIKQLPIMPSLTRIKYT